MHCAKSRGSRPVWWLEPYQQPHLYPPLPALSPDHPSPPAQPLLRGFQGLGRISALCKVPRVGMEPLGWHMASRHHTAMPPRCWAVLAGSRKRGGGDQECHVPCRERAVPPPGVAPAGCPMAAPRVHCQERKQPHQSTPYLTGCRLQLLSPGRAWAPAQLLPFLVLALKRAFLQCAF